MKVLAITQARTGSSRLPQKVLKIVEGETLLNIHIKRILRSELIDKLIVATTTDPADDIITELAEIAGVSFYRGSMNDVLDRFYQAAKPFSPEYVVRLTSDCPLIDPGVIDNVIDMCMHSLADYCSNSLDPTFPDGMDVEVFKFAALEKAWKEADTAKDREHVTPYIYRNSSFFGKELFNSGNYFGDDNYGHVRLTIDEPQDLEVLSILIKKLGSDSDWKSYADAYLSDAGIKSLNSHIKRNEGSNKPQK